MILSTLDKSRKGGAYEQIPSLVLGQRWTPQLNSRNMFGVNNKFYDAAMLVLKEAVNDKYDYISWWLYEGEPDYKVWSSDNTEEWNLTEPEALYDFIVNECQE